MTELQLDKLYRSCFNLKRFRKFIDEADTQAIIDYLKPCGGCVSHGIGWDEKNHTIIDIDKNGIEFDDSGERYSFEKIAERLIEKYRQDKEDEMKEDLKLSAKSTLDIECIKSMSINEIEKYGANIQNDISEGMSKILESTKCIEIEKTGKSLSDLSVETNSISKKIGSVQKLPTIMKASKWLARYDSVENRIDSLESGVIEEKDRLNLILGAMFENLQFMRDKLKNLEQCKSELQIMVDYFQNNDEDGLKLQAAMHRLKIITITISVVKQECAKTILIIKENKEVTNQLSEASDNLIPVFKVMMLNAIGAKTNAEAMLLKQNLSKIANNIIVTNAKQIEKTADDLIKGREEPLISAKSIEEANSILQNAILKVQNSAKAEVQTNMDSVKRLESSIKQIDGLMQNGIGDIDD